MCYTYVWSSLGALFVISYTPVLHYSNKLINWASDGVMVEQGTHTEAVLEFQIRTYAACFTPFFLRLCPVWTFQIKVSDATKPALGFVIEHTSVHQSLLKKEITSNCQKIFLKTIYF